MEFVSAADSPNKQADEKLSCFSLDLKDEDAIST